MTVYIPGGIRFRGLFCPFRHPRNFRLSPPPFCATLCHKEKSLERRSLHEKPSAPLRRACPDPSAAGLPDRRSRPGLCRRRLLHRRQRPADGAHRRHHALLLQRRPLRLQPPLRGRRAGRLLRPPHQPGPGHPLQQLPGPPLRPGGPGGLRQAEQPLSRLRHRAGRRGLFPAEHGLPLFRPDLDPDRHGYRPPDPGQERQRGPQRRRLHLRRHPPDERPVQRLRAGPGGPARHPARPQRPRRHRSPHPGGGGAEGLPPL